MLSVHFRNQNLIFKEKDMAQGASQLQEGQSSQYQKGMPCIFNYKSTFGQQIKATSPPILEQSTNTFTELSKYMDRKARFL